MYAFLSEDTKFSKDEIRWAIDQCERQGEGVDAVLPFLEGWEYARQNFKTPNEKKMLGGLSDQISYLAMIVTDGNHTMSRPYRKTPVVFANGNTGINPEHIPRTVYLLCASGLITEDINAFIIEYLKIHPLEDGNGRVANILLNRFSEGEQFIYDNPKEEGWIDRAS